MTSERIAAAVGILTGIADVIREKREVPAGHLYAAMMPHGITHEHFERIIGTLERTKLIERTPAHLIRWTGPEIARAGQ